MPSVSLLLWLAAALSALFGAALSLWGTRILVHAAPVPRAYTMAAAAASAGLVAVGLAWRGWAMQAWPAASSADALALLAFGALFTYISTGLVASRFGLSPWQPAAAAAVLAASAMILAAAVLAAALGPVGAIPARGGAWLYGLAGVVAALGLGGLLAVLPSSMVWALGAREAGVRSDPLPGLVLAYLPANDEGRLPALHAYPWLTLGLVLVSLWNLSAHAAVWRGVPGELWLLASWLLSSAYLHVTSGWRPLRLPAWLPPLIAALAAITAVMAALTLNSLLVE